MSTELPYALEGRKLHFVCRMALFYEKIFFDKNTSERQSHPGILFFVARRPSVFIKRLLLCLSLLMAERSV